MIKLRPWSARVASTTRPTSLRLTAGLWTTTAAATGLALSAMKAVTPTRGAPDDPLPDLPPHDRHALQHRPGREILRQGQNRPGEHPGDTGAPGASHRENQERPASGRHRDGRTPLPLHHLRT